MILKIVGRIPDAVRISTGLWSLDRALAGPKGELGLPTRGGIEIYGSWETGKSTIGYYLAGRAAPTDGTIVLVDLEGGARREYLESAVGQSGFDGTIRYIEHTDGKKGRTHADMLQEAADLLLEDDVWAVMVDSAAIVQSIVEREGDLGDANMGRRAQLLAQFTRRWVPNVNTASLEKNALVIEINHMLQSMGGFGKLSPGGDTPKFGINARLWIRRADKGTFKDGSFEAEVYIEKLRQGGKSKSRQATVFIVPGIGVSVHLTALFDCFGLGLAERRRGVVWYNPSGGDDMVKLARLTTLIERVRKGNTKDLIRFVKMLEAHDG